ATLGAVAGRAVVLGAGGTAQSALAALREAGIADVTVLVRDLGRAEELRATAERLGVAPRVRATLADPAQASAELADADVVISTLSAHEALATHRALGGRADELGVLGQHPGPQLGQPRGPALAAARQLGLVDVDGEGAVGDVQHDPVAVAHERDRPAVHRL